MKKKLFTAILLVVGSLGYSSRLIPFSNKVYLFNGYLT